MLAKQNSAVGAIS